MHEEIEIYLTRGPADRSLISLPPEDPPAPATRV